MKRNEVNKANSQISSDNSAKDDACPDLAGIKLTRISLAANHTAKMADSCQHDQIDTNKTYLVLIYNQWCLGKFSKQWYGWSFNNWGNAGIQLDSIQIVYETDLVVPDLDHQPYIKFEATECEWCDAALPDDDNNHDENGLVICDDCWKETYG